MSVAHALEFIDRVRTDETLRTRLEALANETRFEPLIALGAERGLTFTAPELQTAFQYDWMMRRLRFGSVPPDSLHKRAETH